MPAEVPTLDEIRAWPATVSVPKAATALGISKTYLHGLIKRGESPVRVLPLEGRHRVITASLVRLLEGS
ncbi:DNA-binding protein [Streptomyces sp. NPDC057623]|uniref:DNA-binding protein n=1 Tax=Streptomyces sp. NPDC057623 TaxID=3346187 RepID=UPI0036BC0E12